MIHASYYSVGKFKGGKLSGVFRSESVLVVIQVSLCLKEVI